MELADVGSVDGRKKSEGGGLSALVRFGIALAFTCLACVPARAQQSQLTPFSNWMAYVGGLTGYTVTQGDAVPFGQSGGCAAFVHVLGSCFGNNPATPYIIIQPPLGQATLPSWTQITPFEGPSPYGATVNDFYQVAMSDTNNLPMSDAIVTVITLPPTGAYWSFQSYMIERAAQYYETTPTNCPSPFSDSNGSHVSTPDCGYNVFGLFNNTINNAVVFNQFGQGFSDPNLANPVAIAIITTPNAALYTALQQAFYEPNGVTPFGTMSEIFQEAMPTSGTASLNVGTASNSDVMASIIRCNLAEVQTAGDTWTGSPSTYINVYRVHSTGSQTASSTPSLTTQSFNTHENVARYQNDLTELSGLLVSYLNGNPSSGRYKAVQATSNAYDDFKCIEYGRYCQGGTEDNDSYRYYQVGQLPSGSYAIVAGILHSTSAADTGTPPGPINNSSYTGVSWADNTVDNLGIAENEGVGGVAQSNYTYTGLQQGPLEGSAYEVLSDTGLLSSASPQLTADLPNFYVSVLTRTNTSCQNALCSPTKTYVNIISQHAPPTGIPLTDQLSITERGYLLPGVVNPQTGMLPTSALTGASASDLLSVRPITS